MIVLRVPHSSVIEVRSGRLKIRWIAFRHLVNVQGMFARRQIGDIQLDVHSMRRFRKRGCTDVLTIGILKKLPWTGLSASMLLTILRRSRATDQ